MVTKNYTVWKHQPYDSFSVKQNKSVSLCLTLFNLSYSALMESLITPLQDKIEDWKKTANQLDKDHAKGTHAHITGYNANIRSVYTMKVLIFFVIYQDPQTMVDKE